MICKKTKPSLRPLVSIIMPAFNASSTIHGSILSVVNQTYVNWELLVVDDCSNDETPLIVYNMSLDNKNIKLLATKSNLGPSHARNLGIANVSGSYIAFLDSDDTWAPHKLELQINFALSSKSPITYCKYARVNYLGDIIGNVAPPANIGLADMFERNHIGLLTGMYCLSTFPSAIFPDSKHEDYVFWTNLVRQHGQASLVPSSTPLAFYMVRNNSLNGNKLRSAAWHWRNLREDFKLSFLCSANFFLKYIVFNILNSRFCSLISRKNENY